MLRIFATRRLGLFFCLLAAGAAARALPTARVDVFTAAWPVADQSEAARREAFRAALGEVLVRLTGRAEVVTAPQAAALLDGAARFVQRYHYEAAEDPGLWHLVVRFDERAVLRGAEAAGLPVWPLERPRVLLWLVVDAPGQAPRFVAESSEGPWAAALRRAAEARGLPLTLPLLDLEDSRRVRVADVRGGFLETLREAGRRYEPAVTVAAWLAAEGGRWRLRWEAVGERLTWRDVVEGEEPEAVLARLVHALTERLAAQWSALEPAETTLRLRVEAVPDLPAYAALLHLLEESGGTVRLLRAGPAGLWFDLDARLDPAALDRRLRLDGRLQPLETVPAPADDPLAPRLVYRWRR
ncbi:MAG: hypothetical protein KatS3mg121_0536 [Gammaproteobacteria bacterium]|nr:MAG: hypothetical protein KatS3mg121_0536 [Gammaproteobacteria bacterium]